MFSYIWEYRVRSSHVDEFRAAYAPEGTWALLFRRDPGYIRTELLRDNEDASRFVTIDYWISREAYLAFRERYREEFDELDARCEEWTGSETHIGEFSFVRS